jgi:type IV pilus assembly protein PilF
MRHESIALALVLALAAASGCSKQGRVIEMPGYSGPSAEATAPKRGELSNSGSINLSLAQQYLRVGQLELALDRANRALSTDSGNGNVHAVLGLVYDSIGDQGKAASAFQRAVQLSPNAGGVVNAYGTWLCAHGDTAGAAQQFDRALADPFYRTPGLVHFNAGKCLLKAGQPAQAEALLRRSLDEPGSDLAAALLALAQAALAQNKLLEARGFVQRRESMGASADVLELAARIEDAAGDAVAAKRYRERLQALMSRPGGGEGHR